MKTWSLVFLSLLGFGEAAAQETYEVETPEGVVEGTQTTVDAFPQEVTDIEESVLKAIEANVALAPSFVKEFVPDAADPDLKDYDEAFRRWQIAASNGETDIGNAVVVDILGSVLGNELVSNLDMKWVRVTDQYGTDYAVKGQTSEVFAYPFSTVRKRVVAGQYDFMYKVYHAVRQAMGSGEYLERKADTD